jgi:hypothetical protein
MSERVPSINDFQECQYGYSDSEHFELVQYQGDITDDEITFVIKDRETNQHWMATFYWPGSWDMFSEASEDDVNVFKCEPHETTVIEFKTVGKGIELSKVEDEDWEED